MSFSLSFTMIIINQSNDLYIYFKFICIIVSCYQIISNTHKNTYNKSIGEKHGIKQYKIIRYFGNIIK